MSHTCEGMDQLDDSQHGVTPIVPLIEDGVLRIKPSEDIYVCSGSGARQQLQAGADPGVHGQTQRSAHPPQEPALQHSAAGRA